MTESTDARRPRARRERIVQMVRERERITVDALANVLGTSKETIRRDLTDLAERGLVRKFHGGATLIEPRPFEPNVEGLFTARLLENAEAKRAIARCAIRLFEPGDTLFVDTGTTTLLFAGELAQASGGFTVITNSAAIAALATRGDANSTFLIGGEYRADSNEILDRSPLSRSADFMPFTPS